jgi:hypothetical protein
MTMKLRSIITLILITASITHLAAMGAEEPHMPKRGVSSGERFEIVLEPGEYYSKDVNYVVYRYTVWPQVAVWITDLDGNYISTLYVTDVIVQQNFDAAPEEGRPEALPIWYGLQKESVDAVSSPTTVGSTVQFGNDIASELPDGEYLIFLETNRSYDWNDRYTKKNSGVNGQPSLLYQAKVSIGGPTAEVEFIPVGTGSVDGSDGLIYDDLSGIDTAYQLFEKMSILYFKE